MNNDFAVFILTYGRPDNVLTIKTLRESGYTGKIFLICSDDDSKLYLYKEKYNDDVIVFSKNDYKGTFDIGDNFNDDRVVVYARNAIFDIVKNFGYTYFLMLDDDYIDFRYKFDGNMDFINIKKIKSLDNIFSYFLNYYKSIPCLSIAFAQGGDYIGGKKASKGITIRRKIMNSFFCSVERPFKFVGRINEDVNTYVTLGNIGKLVFQTNQIALQQKITQTNSGGLTEFYLDGGTYVKSFYTIIFSPSNVKISTMGNINKRLHHKINWRNTTSYIINEKYKKI